MSQIKKILIANRGEIAIRVIRAAREMGIQTVAVYSEVDSESRHVMLADQCVCIGPAQASESYLNIDKLVEACKSTNSDAVHPGYGFLSENQEFAERLLKEGITFIGPSSKAISLMGDKITAKNVAQEAGLPLLPGTDHAVESKELAAQIAGKIGYPLMIKATAGGGGKGMRVAYNEPELLEQFERASSEASSSFGNPDIFIEKYITSPRHIEIQVVSDQHGNYFHLLERDCSIQRRHQKVLEECPGPGIGHDLRKSLGEDALKIARAVDYVGAGTVEFIMDEDDKYYFLEMNTRLQVEHPVTEEVTGIDLVKSQIRVAQGEKLTFIQDDISPEKHAIEFRIYAEDPTNNYFPSTGTVSTYFKPQGRGVRIDDGIESGSEISIHYDPMIGKLIAIGDDRQEAIAILSRALRECTITGVITNLSLGRHIISQSSFVKGKYTTKFLEEYPMKPSQSNNEEALVASLAAWKEKKSEKKETPQPIDSQSESSWKNRQLK